MSSLSSEALRRGERARVEQRLRNERVPSGELRALLAGSSPELVHAALLHLKNRLVSLEGGDTPEPLLEALPEILGACEPETHVLLAELARVLPPQVPMSRLQILADGRGLRPIEAEEAWLVTEAAREPRRFGARPLSELVLGAARKVSPAEALDAEALIDVLCEHASPDMQLVGLRHLGTALSLGLVPLARVLDMASQALGATDSRVALQALELLAEPWAARPGGRDASLQEWLGRSEPLAIAALRVLARRGEGSALRLVLGDERQPRAVRREAMALLAPFASHDELRLALLVSRQDAIFFGATCARLLQTLYRRGVRCESDDVPLVRELYLAHRGIEPATVAEVLSLRQREYVDSIRELPLTDPGFSRHLALLREFDGPEAAGLLRGLLARPEARPVWPEVIEALGHLEHVEAEEEILGRFGSEPWACLEALRRLGGARTLAFLRSRLAPPAAGADGEREEVWHEKALSLLAALEEEPSRRTAVLTASESDAAVLASLQSLVPESAFQEVSRMALQAQHPLRLQAIAQLGRVAPSRALPILGELLLDPDEAVRAATHAAITEAGRSLHVSRRVRPRCLLKARSDADAGALILAEALLDQLQRPGLSDAQLERVLSQLVGKQHPALPRRVRRFLRHESVRVQKLALECLGASGDPRVVAWLAPLARADDIYRLRQALAGLGAFEVEWASPLLEVGLEHPNMNIKKTAAEALGKAGPGWPPPIGALLRWLRRHDNPGLRELLIRALQRACGRGTVATVLDALESAASVREQDLLCEALSGSLVPRTLVALVQRQAPFVSVLLDAVYGEDITLKEGGLRELDALLRRFGLAQWIPTTATNWEMRKHLRARQLDVELAWMDELLVTGDASAIEASGEELAKALLAAVSDGLPDARASVLKRHLEVIQSLLDSPSAHLRRAGLATLGALGGSLSAPERVGAINSVRRALAASRIELHEALTVLKRLEAAPTLEEARAASTMPDESLTLWGTERLVLAGELAGSSLLETLVRTRSAAVRRLLLPFAVRAMPFDLLEAAGRAQLPGLLEAVREAWDASVPQDVLLERLMHMAEATPGSAAPLVRWIRELGTDPARAALRRLARHHEPALALAALEALGAPSSAEDVELLTGLALQPRMEIRRQAARRLWWIRELPQLHLLLDQFRNEHPVRWVPPESLERRELEALLATLDSVEEGEEGSTYLEGLVRLLDHVPAGEHAGRARAALLFRIWELGRGQASLSARNALRHLPQEQVLPLVLPRLREGSTAALDVLSRVDSFGPEWRQLFARARGLARRHFLELLLRSSVEGDSLTKELLRIIDEDEDERALALQVLGRLPSWGRREEALRLGSLLVERVNRKGESGMFETLLQGLSRHPPEFQVALLAQVQSPALREGLVAAVTTLVLDDPSLLKMLSADLQRDIEARIDELAWESAEPDRRALAAVARRQPSAPVAERLAGLLSHRKTWVRIRVHRLLRDLVPREAYLELTRQLLQDPEPGHVVRAIRILSFGKHLPAVPELAAMLNDHRNPIARAAREGLQVLGETALPALRSLVAHARPDRRAVLADIIHGLEQSADTERAQGPRRIGTG